MNHAAEGVLPQPTRDAIVGFVDAHGRRGVLGTAPYEAALPEYRAKVAGLIGAEPAEIALLRSTADGANVIAGGIDWNDGDEIVLSGDEFGSNAYPWLETRRYGVRIHLIPAPGERLTPDRLRAAMTPRTRLVAVSWVAFGDGYRRDVRALREIAREAGALFVVDGIQGLGVFPFDVRETPCDALYAGGAKWLLALQGISFVYVRAELLERLRLRAPGWRSVADMWDFLNYGQPFVPNVSRFEGGTPNFVGALSLATSIEFLQGHDVGAIGRHVLALTDCLAEGLAAMGARILGERTGAQRSGIVTFVRDGVDPLALGRALHKAGFCVTYRKSGIRVSPHGYNTVEEIDAFLAAVAELSGGVPSRS